MTGHCERLTILPVADLGAIDKDILPGSDGRMFFPDLYFHDVGGMLDDLANVRLVIRPDFSQNSLSDEEKTPWEPVFLLERGARLRSARIPSRPSGRRARLPRIRRTSKPCNVPYDPA